MGIRTSTTPFQLEVEFIGATPRSTLLLPHFFFAGTQDSDIVRVVRNISHLEAILPEDDFLLGEIRQFLGAAAPAGWVLCDGQNELIADYPDLFNLIGTAYGGDGVTDFGIPDFRGRSPIHKGSGPSLPTYALGDSGGAHEQTLVEANLPAHTHTFAPPANSNDGILDSPTNGYPATHSASGDAPYSNTSNVTMGAGTTGSAGSGTAVSVQNPYVAVNFILRALA